MSVWAGRWKFSYCAGALSGTDCTTNNGNVMNQQIQPLNIFQNYSYDELNRIAVMEESTSASASPACGSGTTPCQQLQQLPAISAGLRPPILICPVQPHPQSSPQYRFQMLFGSEAEDGVQLSVRPSHRSSGVSPRSPSLLAQSHDWFHLHRSPGREIASRSRHCDQQH